MVSQEDISMEKFLDNLREGYSKIKNDHIIINLFSFSELKADDLLEFLEFSNAHRKNKKSLVIVTEKIPYDQVPEDICVVPSLQEARDIIEMEEIERDLGL